MARQFIMLMTDTTRKDMLGCYGDERMKTPNLDKLAEEGLRFDNAYTTQPVCGPARSGLFTGTFPHTNGVTTNCVPLGLNVKTIGQRLTDNGVKAAYIGKWHLDGGDYFGLGQCPEGWDPEYWFDMHNYLEEMTDEERMASRQSSSAFENGGWPEEMCYAHRSADKALDYIQKHKDDDFFLVLSFDEPHGPCLCPTPFNTMYKDFHFEDDAVFHEDFEGKPLMQRLWSGADADKDPSAFCQASDSLSLFLGCNSYADYEFGRVIDLIDDVCPDATVMFTSDHGDMLGAHRLQGKNAAFYKEITNIPFIIRDGKNSQKGVVDFPTSHIDVAPTVLEFFGIPVPKLLEGKSMMPTLKDPSVKTNDYVFTEFTRYEVDHDGFGGLQMMRACTDGRYKLTINFTDTDELYDLESDPAERKNLINDPAYAEIRDRMHDEILEHMNDTRDLYRGYQWYCRPWRKDAIARWQNDGCTRQRENEEYEPRQWDYDTGLPMKEAIRGKKLYDVKN